MKKGTRRDIIVDHREGKEWMKGADNCRSVRQRLMGGGRGKPRREEDKQTAATF